MHVKSKYASSAIMQFERQLAIAQKEIDSLIISNIEIDQSPIFIIFLVDCFIA